MLPIAPRPPRRARFSVADGAVVRVNGHPVYAQTFCVRKGTIYLNDQCYDAPAPLDELDAEYSHLVPMLSPKKTRRLGGTWWTND